ncbi:LuxR C-terminal-related transcriptional regulator [Vibrio agarivorans]|uniref:LuxR C-terminal-related transcriptional regulator n=1 Tax=Vibrio agarivorans TaxID=153622 RepID=UPI00222E6E6E|nr:LuxR C-terminal-related transcriptional regulator [Vibrio agarivorans]MDN3660812.1 LuxR C-terminal-related transcriptional regulator [Vibrio agarivorans]
MKQEESTEIILLADVSMQSNLFKESLESNLQVMVEVLPFSELKLGMHAEGASHSWGVKENSIVILDYSSLSEEDANFYSSLKADIARPLQEVLINCPSDISFNAIFRWRDLVGVFYLQDDLRNLVKGMTKILEGEMWLSRKLAQQYIMHYRNSHSVSTSSTYQSLTKREKQIIRLLGHGASNHQIADELFVSENTVKTHLHNIFKKINAKNRLQALLWANNNIGMEELS